MAEYPDEPARDLEREHEAEGAPASEGAKTDAQIVEEAKERFKLAADAEQENRQKALADLKFRTGDQWDAQTRANRERDARPCLTINRLPQHVQQVTNDQRQNRPSIKVHPVDDNADVDTAKKIQGLIRHIEYNSSADHAYDTAFESTVGEGLGYLRVITDYASPLSFDQEILIKRVRDRFAVYFDPHSQEPDGSDASFAFIVDSLPKSEFLSQFPKAELSQSGQWDTYGASTPDWVEKDSVRIAEYFYKETTVQKIVQLSNGDVILASALPTHPALQTGVTVVRERMAPVPVIKWCKINGCEILEKTELPGHWIPVIPVYGTEHIIDGKRVLKGITRDAMDSQKVYNVMKSAEMEAIGLAPKAPFVAEENQLEGYEQDWATANTRNHAFLKYKAHSVNGTPLPPPQRMAFEPAVMAITQAAMGASEDVKATTGIYDASLGGRSNETSGIAIQRRNVQAQTSNFHYVDNLTRSMRHLGRILVAWIPFVYDTAQTVRIIGEDDTHETVRINEEFDEHGEKKIYDLTTGRYDVTVSVGPSYTSKRQEASASMMEFAKAVPAAAAITGDLIAKSQDWPGADKFAERLKKALPPGMADDEKDQAPVPPQVQAQMTQMGQMIEQLTGKLNEAEDTIQQKRVELESKERIEMAKLETQAAIELAKLESKEALSLLANQIAELEARQRQLGSLEPIPDVTQDSAPEHAGAPMGAPVGDVGAEAPTGGVSPGPMEGPDGDHRY